MTLSGSLRGKVAMVAGASRGCGRGIACALGDAGATVYVTGRTIRGGPQPVDQAAGTIEDTAEEVTRRGGNGIPVRVDHTDPVQVEELFARVGTLDILACAVWGGNERYLDPAWRLPFWEQTDLAWNETIGAGPYAFWLAARSACAIMARRKSGLIVAVSEPVTDQFEGQQPSLAETFSQIAHYATNRLVQDFARDTRKSGIAVIGLLPGFMRTERVEMHLPDEAARQRFRYDLSESPEYCGRAVVALAASPERALAKSGDLSFVAAAAEEFDFTDVDGRRIANFYEAVRSP